MFNLTWFDAVLWWIAIFFSGVTAFAVATRHRARDVLIGLYILMMILLVLLAGIGKALGLV